MKPVPWLLVGGPRHGTLLTLKYGVAVITRDFGVETLYAGENYNTNGRLYRIGVCSQTTNNDRAQIDTLIAEKQLRPIAGD